jgi:AcrR family transcriptional regulator
MAETLHPTAQKIMDTVSIMLEGDNPHNILVDDVLETSGISRGALYYHFGDFPALIEQTLLQRFSKNVDLDTLAIKEAASESQSSQEFWSRIRSLSAATQTPERATVRAERARILALAATSERFGLQLAEEQTRLTRDMAHAIEHAQKQGWVTQELDATAIAVLLQAYSLGRIVDDIIPERLDNKKWVKVVDTVLLALQKSP